MATWTNNDGLLVNFGTDQAASDRAGRVSTDGDVQELVVKIVGSEVPAADDIVSSNVGVPDGAYLISATLYVKTLFVGATATLDIGLFNDDGDGTFSANDVDGIDAAIAVAALTADAEIACDGALIGTTLAGTGDRDLYVSTGYNTAAFTAGEADLVIKYRIPSATPGL